MAKKDGHFKIKKVTKLKDVATGKIKNLPESDLCFQNEEDILQFEYVEGKEKEYKFNIKPGVYTLSETNAGVKPVKSELRKHRLLDTVDNTSIIIHEAKVFFNKLHIYEKLGRPKKRGILLYSKPGMGKCLGRNTPILMYDGSMKMVQDIVNGDLLMGPNSTPRTVMSTVIGSEQLYRIIPNKGDPYVVNESHILSLRLSGLDELQNISIKDYIELPNWKKERLKGWRTGVKFDNQDELIIDPYFLGLWLGDGTSAKPELCTTDTEIENYTTDYYKKLNLKCYKHVENGNLSVLRASSGEQYGKKYRNKLINMLRSYSLINNKHIPLVYKTSSKENRLKLLAGLVDTDGSVYSGVVDFCFKNKVLTNDIAFLARSLGFAAYIKETQKICTNSKTKAKNTYYRLQISGNLSMIPTKLLRKQAPTRQQIKNVLRTGVVVEKLGIGDYYGFEIDGDKLFLLGDFTVTHNTSAITKICRDFVKEDKGTVILNWPTSEIEADGVAKFLSRTSKYDNKCTRLVLIIEDIGGAEYESERRGGVDSGLLNLLDGIDVTFKLPTFIIATTNYPENLLSALADRPGRFDLMLELKSPSYKEKISLIEFIAKRKLKDDEKIALKHKDANDFSIAHLEEVVIRSMLHDKTIPETIKEMIDHKKKFKDNFIEKKNLGLGLGS